MNEAELGVRDMGPITFTGHWNTGVLPKVRQKVVLYLHCTRVFGLELWDERHVFESEVSGAEDGLNMQPVGIVQVEKAERWRRVLWHLVGRPVGYLRCRFGGTGES